MAYSENEDYSKMQKMQDERTFSIKTMPGISIKGVDTPKDRDPECIENLIANIVSQVGENKHALRSLRADYLGPWPENPSTLPSGEVPYGKEGLIGQLRVALYSIMEDNREIRDHIVAISKGVR